jgi:hypothetical protein
MWWTGNLPIFDIDSYSKKSKATNTYVHGLYVDINHIMQLFVEKICHTLPLT